MKICEICGKKQIEAKLREIKRKEIKLHIAGFEIEIAIEIAIENKDL